MKSNLDSQQNLPLLVLIFAITTFVFVNGIEVTPTIVYGKNKTSSQSLSNTISHRIKLPSVRITSPVRGQNVQVGKNLVVSGISASRSSSCAVSVMVNGIKPYQNATAIGPKGQKDYSRWTFLILPKYTIIKEGVNKIASKISCDNKPSLVSYYTLNVTGLVGSGGSFSSSHPHVVTANNPPPQIATPLP
ncbi:MAG: hypothetical protein WAM14_01135 [Candidatus Nitrosopolaris sp.]